MSEWKIQYPVPRYRHRTFAEGKEERMTVQLTPCGWAVLAQLHKGPVWDGDLVSKSGRDELVSRKLAMRDRKDEHGLMRNELTQMGHRLAARYTSVPGMA